MLRSVKLWLIGFGNNNIKKLPPRVSVTQRILKSMLKQAKKLTINFSDGVMTATYHNDTNNKPTNQTKDK
jgi:hypothetical protein